MSPAEELSTTIKQYQNKRIKECLDSLNDESRQIAFELIELILYPTQSYYADQLRRLDDITLLSKIPRKT